MLCKSTGPKSNALDLRAKILGQDLPNQHLHSYSCGLLQKSTFANSRNQDTDIKMSLPFFMLILWIERLNPALSLWLLVSWTFEPRLSINRSRSRAELYPLGSQWLDSAPLWLKQDKDDWFPHWVSANFELCPFHGRSRGRKSTSGWLSVESWLTFGWVPACGSGRDQRSTFLCRFLHKPCICFVFFVNNPLFLWDHGKIKSERGRLFYFKVKFIVQMGKDMPAI